MNIGIMTFHWAANHGALLQTYALQKSLEDLFPGSNAMIVDYKPARYDWNLKRVFNSRNMRVVRENLREVKKEKLLTPFRNCIPKTKRYYTVDELIKQPPECDVFISGSDQIWNEFYTMNGEGKKTPAYFLPFKPEATHLSYAASFGATSLKPEMVEYILPYLKKLDAISVRERTGQELVAQMGLPCQIVCDPSVLLNRQAYCNLAQPAFSGRYTAKYFLRKESAVAVHAIRHYQKDSKVRDVTLLPMEKWIGAIKDAEFLLTNSFHGMMVALKMHVPFAIFLSDGVLTGMNDRFYTLLDKLDLSDRIVGNDTDIEKLKCQSIDWTRIDRVMEIYADQSIAYLKEYCKSRKTTGPIVQNRNEECCGCTACEQICPTKSIRMFSDDEGFLYPRIQMETCVKCGKCAYVCPIKNNPIEKVGIPVKQAYIARTKNAQLLEDSSSGGVFSVLAQHVLENQGVVFSVVMADDCKKAVYAKAENKTDLAAMRGSKYVQSYKNDIFTQVRQALHIQRQVLFCGTPCDVNGLQNYLYQTRTPINNLILVDFICHGVPSPLVWERYVECRQSNAFSLAQSVQFRNKQYGWKDFSMAMSFVGDQTYLARKGEDAFLKGFLSDLYLRPSCYECTAKGMKRTSDITLGDAWGVEHSAFNDDKGASLVLLHSEKSQRLLQQIENRLQYALLDSPECAVKYNNAMVISSAMNDRRSVFMAQLHKKKKIDKLILKNCRDPFVLAVKKRIKQIIRGA